jgi:acylphosphatase
MAATRHVTVSGRVQGVFFRAWTKNQAEALGISGWVRNRHDGGVEALISGDEKAVEEMIERMRRGPPSATVDRLAQEPSDEVVAEGFVVRH